MSDGGANDVRASGRASGPLTESRHVQSRPNGAWELARKVGLFRRLTLRRADGQVYLDRWGISLDRVGGVLLHRMRAPDPGVDLHDHPWWFVTIPLWGGYVEERASIRDAPALATEAEEVAEQFRVMNAARGAREVRAPRRPKVMRLDECHRIVALLRRPTWTLVIKGPRRRKWGFYLPSGYMPEAEYDATVRADRRDLWSDQNERRPW